MSKDFLEKTDVNSVRYSGIGGDCALQLALKASARRWEMVKDAPIVVDGNTSKRDIRLVARMRSPSSMHRDSGGMSETSSLGESES